MKNDLSLNDIFKLTPKDSYFAWFNRLLMKRPVCIIIPVYNFTAELACFLNDKEIHKLIHKIILVDDLGPNKDFDIEFKKYSDDLKDLCIIIKNHRNLGFVKSVNNGIKSSPEGCDVIVLNSDAIISRDTIDRLVVSAYSFDNIATVSPISNNNGFFSINSGNCSLDDASSNLDKIHGFLCNHSFPIHEVVPVNNGFCLYITRGAINSIGLLDENLYYRGYAEETDFCFRATMKGWVNIVSFCSFGYHDAGVSFGVEKDVLKKNNAKILKSIYPNFISMLSSFESNSLMSLLSENSTRFLMLDAAINVLYRVSLCESGADILSSDNIISIPRQLMSYELLIFVVLKFRRVCFDQSIIEIFPNNFIDNLCSLSVKNDEG